MAYVIAAATLSQYVTGWAVIFGIAVLVLNQLGVLDKIGLKGKSAADAEAELVIADRTNARMLLERDAAVDRANLLEKERSLAPILEVVGEVMTTVSEVMATVSKCSQGVDMTLEKLASFNGSLKHIESGLRDATEGLKAVTGTIAELHDLPMRPSVSEEAAA